MTNESPTEVEAIMLLCDSAQSIAGKLYVLGGGWEEVSRGLYPTGLVMALAIKLLIPWDRANEQIPIHIDLVTDQSEPVRDPNGAPLRAMTTIEVGRPPGKPRGAPLGASVALNFANLPLEAGGYAWLLEADDAIKARAAFRVLP